VEGGGREEGRGEKRVEDARRRTRGGGRRGVGRQKRSDALGSRRAIPVFSSLVAPLAVPLLFARALFT